VRLPKRVDRVDEPVAAVRRLTGEAATRRPSSRNGAADAPQAGAAYRPQARSRSGDSWSTKVETLTNGVEHLVITAYV